MKFFYFNTALTGTN